MLNLKRTGGGLGRSDRKSERRRPGIPWRKVVDSALIVAAGLVVVYTATVAAGVLENFTVVRQTPINSIRLQIVDASGQSGLLAEARDAIDAVTNDALALEVVETTRFDLRQVNSSYVVSRLEDCGAARLLADKLGLNPDEVEYRPLVNNRHLVTATLVFGAQGVSPIMAQPMEEET